MIGAAGRIDRTLRVFYLALSFPGFSQVALGESSVSHRSITVGPLARCGDQVGDRNSVGKALVRGNLMDGAQMGMTLPGRDGVKYRP